MDFPIRNGDFPLQNVSSPEGSINIAAPAGSVMGLVDEKHLCSKFVDQSPIGSIISNIYLVVHPTNRGCGLVHPSDFSG